jgi:hypothetical protein
MGRYHAETIFCLIVIGLLGVVLVDCFRKGQQLEDLHCSSVSPFAS